MLVPSGREGRGLYLGVADSATVLDATMPSCMVVQSMLSSPNDSAFLCTSRSRAASYALDNVATPDFEVGQIPSLGADGRREGQ